MPFSAARKGDPTAHGGAVLNGSADVFINGSPAAFVGCSATSCPVHYSGQAVVRGSSTVFINKIPAVFVGSPTSCGASITSGSPNVFIGDGQLTKTISRSESVERIMKMTFTAEQTVALIASYASSRGLSADDADEDLERYFEIVDAKTDAPMEGMTYKLSSDGQTVVYDATLADGKTRAFLLKDHPNLVFVAWREGDVR